MEIEGATTRFAQACDASGALVAQGRLAALAARLAQQAEAMTALRAGRSRHHRRGAASWTCEDEAVFGRYLADLTLASVDQVADVLRTVAACGRRV